ncbi:hypothetical protein SAMN02745174_02059 [Cetobacterium ceti]|uniref:Uncharacterized protein n=1 Tax=Cetobacterium ceti TaxID=180163 RepID=A0A1T4PV24_9FUSO|nr:hypothetical protein [Cetobacterium ceti]SJZ95402.1 hypothetical protein SAMN02745174_02059 [Cetobacterium ceti]
MESLGLDHATIKTSISDRELLFIKKSIVDKFKLGTKFMEDGVYKFPLTDKSNFINYIEIKEKYGKGHYLIIDFNYPRYFSKSNFHLLYQQSHKKIVDEYLKTIITEILDIEIKMSYMMLEIAGQLYVKIFSDFYKVINLIARAKANYISKGPTCNFMYLSKRSQREFIKGFTSKMIPGLKNTQYDKTQEHNEKNIDKKLGQELRNEYKATEKVLKTIYGTSDVEELNLNIINMKFTEVQKNIIGEAIEKQLLGDIDILREKLKKLDRITPKNIELFVTEFDEYIFDYKIVSTILKKELGNLKSERMIKNYQKIAKEKLTRLGGSNSPIRNNIGNIKRLAEYLECFYNIKFELKITKDSDFQFIFF